LKLTDYQNVPPLGTTWTDNNAFHLTSGLAFARPSAGECERYADELAVDVSLRQEC